MGWKAFFTRVARKIACLHADLATAACLRINPIKFSKKAHDIKEGEQR